MQFDNSVLRRNVEKLPRGGPPQLVITFGSLSASFHSLSAFLKNHAELAKNWSTKLGVDCSRDEIISALMLNYSVQVNPNGLVLFSSRDALRVKKNVKLSWNLKFLPSKLSCSGSL